MTQRTYRDPHRRTDPVVVRRVDHREHRCVRCGQLPPAPDLFICGRCQADPATMLEVHNIEESFTDSREQRKALQLFGWRGGWWR